MFTPRRRRGDERSSVNRALLNANPTSRSPTSPSVTSDHSFTLEDPAHGGVDLSPQLICLVRQHRELVVQFGEAQREVAIVVHGGGRADVAAGVEAPALGLDLRERRDL